MNTVLSSVHPPVHVHTHTHKYTHTYTYTHTQHTQLLVKQEKIASNHKSRVANLESQLSEVNERCELAEGQIDELKTELQDMEGILGTNRDELSSLNEQLTEVCTLIMFNGAYRRHRPSMEILNVFAFLIF